MEWDLFSSMELDLDKNEVNVVQSAQVEPVSVKVGDAPINRRIINEIMNNVVISPQEEEQVKEFAPKNELNANIEVLAVFDEEIVDSIETEHIEPYTDEETVSYEVGDVVKIIYPTEEEDAEMYNYLHYYYSHLKGKKGRVVKVLPYKKLQYEVEFDTKHEERLLTLYHENLIVLPY
ncbi:hypothetical protein [Solibacillus sp. NPDC093137]|uniref:hypothetical protein n=1 Tax=Solibacillus sp. NPDC093137 TaxID=3390678 RepID=UPI003D06D9FE